MRRFSAVCLLWILPLLVPTEACGFFDEYEGAWHDPRGVEGEFDEKTHIETESDTRESADGSQTTESRGRATDNQGNRVEWHEKETVRPDGTVTTQQDTSHTSQDGVKTTEKLVWEYDKDGNLVNESRQFGTERIEDASGWNGLETEQVTNPGMPGEESSTRRYGGDMAKDSFSDGTETVYHLSAEQAYRIDHSDRAVAPFDLYFCLEWGDAVLSQYGSFENYANQQMSQFLSPMENAPDLPFATPRQTAKVQLPQDPRNDTYEFAGEKKFIGGHLAERVLIKNQGQPHRDVWLSLTISPLGVMNRDKIPQRAKDYFFTPANDYATPEIRRAFHRLILKETMYSPFGDRTRVIRKVRRKKFTPGEFRVPPDYERIDPFASP